MEAKEYIESGILELYVYGLLSQDENEEVFKMASSNPEIQNEIIAIEKTVLDISSSFSPGLPLENYEKIKSSVGLVSEDNSDSSENSQKFRNLGWAVAILFLIGMGYLFFVLEQNSTETLQKAAKTKNIETELQTAKLQNKKNQIYIEVIQDSRNNLVPMVGDSIAPSASAKLYWNPENYKIFVDASNLPEPQKGMEYQVWSLKSNPPTTTSLGLLTGFNKGSNSFFEIDSISDFEKFGITLEPKGGVLVPTMQQMYVHSN